MKFHYAPGATPYNQDEKDALLPGHITTQKELNEWEELNILKAQRWLFAQKRSNLLTLNFLQKLHFKMFEDTWSWAGKLRTHNTNIGLPWHDISSHLISLLGDVEYWTTNKSFPPHEIAAMFHHRLVQIHPFANGNGRHARLMTDALLIRLGQEKFTWGRLNLTEPSKTRQTYIEALKAADNYDYQDLFNFVRT